MSRALIWLIATVGLVLSVTAAQGAAGEEPTEPRRAVAELIDRDGNVVGHATFTEAANDAVLIEVRIEGFTRAAEGEHGMHIHDAGACEPPDFESAGDHYNPEDRDHGLLNPAGPHAGDLPNIRFDESGSGTYDVLTQLVKLDESGLLASAGTTLIIHENPDDYTSESETGDRILCGIIMPHPDEAAD